MIARPSPHRAGASGHGAGQLQHPASRTQSPAVPASLPPASGHAVWCRPRRRRGRSSPASPTARPTPRRTPSRSPARGPSRAPASRRCCTRSACRAPSVPTLARAGPASPHRRRSRRPARVAGLSGSRWSSTQSTPVVIVSRSRTVHRRVAARNSSGTCSTTGVLEPNPHQFGRPFRPGRPGRPSSSRRRGGRRSVDPGGVPLVDDPPGRTTRREVPGVKAFIGQVEDRPAPAKGTSRSTRTPGSSTARLGGTVWKPPRGRRLERCGLMNSSPHKREVVPRSISRCVDCSPAAAGYRPPGRVHHFIDRPGLTDANGVEALHAVSDRAHEREVVRHEQHADAARDPQRVQQRDDRSLHRDVDAEVISSKTRTSGSAASARAIATRCRSPPESRLAWYFSTTGPSATWSSSSTTRSVAALPEAIPELHRSFHDLLDRQSRVQGEIGVRKMYWIACDRGAATMGAVVELGALELDAPGPVLVQLADAARDRGFAGARLAHQGDDLGLAEVEGRRDDLRAAKEDPRFFRVKMMSRGCWGRCRAPCPERCPSFRCHSRMHERRVASTSRSLEQRGGALLVANSQRSWK